MPLLGVGGKAPPGSRRTGLSRCWEGGSGRSFGALAAWAIELVQDVEPGGKEGLAPLTRSHCFLGIVRPGPHGGRIVQYG
jgi:hypothetical protein